MATAGQSHQPAPRKRKQQTVERSKTEPWDAAKDGCTTCSACRSLLIRPTCDAKTQRGVGLTDSRSVVRRSLSGVYGAAMNGCVVCNMVLAVQDTIKQHIEQVDRLDGFKLALYYFNDNRGFNRIDVTPVDHMNRDLSHHGHLHAIRLASTVGLVPRLCLLVKLTTIKARRQHLQLCNPLVYRFGGV